MNKLTTLAELPRPNALKVAGHRYRRVAGKVLIVNAAGRHALLSEEEYRRYLRGLERGTELWQRLQPLGFLREYLDFSALGASYARLGLPAWAGPYRHVVELARGGERMGLRTLRLVLERAFASPAPALELELVADDPAGLAGLVFFAAACSARMADWSDRRASVALRLDAAAARGAGGAPRGIEPRLLRVLAEQRVALRRVERVAGAPAEGIAPAPEGVALRVLARVEPDAAEPAAWVDAWAAAGCRSVRLEPAGAALTRAGAERFAAFFAGALARLVELAADGRFLPEEWCASALCRILDREPREDEGLDLLAEQGYGIDGEVRSSGAVAPALTLGPAARFAPEALRRPRAAACLEAQEGDNQPLCFHCVYKPFCRIPPAGNLALQGTLWGQYPSSPLCDLQMARFDALFAALGDPRQRALLERWR